MIQALASQTHPVQTRPSLDWAPQDLMVLAQMRVMALSCRCDPRQNTPKACALLSLSKSVSQEAYARTLIRAFQSRGARSFTFLKPGTTVQSFDETWLLRALAAARSGDSDSFTFLLMSRFSKVDVRSFSSLIRGLTL